MQAKKNGGGLRFLHMSVDLSESEKKKPGTVEFYNKTEYAVDVADQTAKQYSVKTGTRR